MSNLPIVSLPRTRVSLFSHEIVFRRPDDSIWHTVSLASIDQIVCRPTTHRIAVIALILSIAFTAMAVFLFSSLWLRVPLILFAIPAAVMGITGLKGSQLVIVRAAGGNIVRTCYESRPDVEGFAANCAVALAIAKKSK